MCNKCINPQTVWDKETDSQVQELFMEEEEVNHDLGQCPSCGMSLQNYNGKFLCSYCNEREIDDLCFNE